MSDQRLAEQVVILEIELRQASNWLGGSPLLVRAADALEALRTEVEELKHDLGRSIDNHTADINP